MTERHASQGRLVAGVVAGSGLLALALLLAVAQPTLADLPPRPTSPAAPTAQPKPGLAGGALALYVRFDPAWPWESAPWQGLWTVVQWQDGQGAWHDVAGWQGTLDGVEVADGAVTGHKTWWVGQGDLGKGPFRWIVYAGKAGSALATSAPFDLPGFNGGEVAVEVLLAP
jgi:hypothetical protein